MNGEPLALAAGRDESAAALLETYRRDQLLFVPGAFAAGASAAHVLRQLHAFAAAEADAGLPRAGAAGGCASVLDTWNVENGSGAVLRSPARLLSQLVSALDAADARRGAVAGGRWYTSCVVQHDEKATEQLFAALPCGGAPPFLLDDRGRKAGPPDHTAAGVRGQFHNAECAWIFIGQNAAEDDAGESMRGRPEHTDAISHSGTWHMQLAGSKVWSLRPNPAADWPAGSSAQEALQLVQRHGTKEPGSDVSRLRISCHAGDLLLLNTRLWFHSTQIPATVASAGGGSGGGGQAGGVGLPLSMSVARDFYLGRNAKELAAAHSSRMTPAAATTTATATAAVAAEPATGVFQGSAGLLSLRRFFPFGCGCFVVFLTGCEASVVNTFQHPMGSRNTIAVFQ
jgi:hypothetical protein